MATAYQPQKAMGNNERCLHVKNIRRHIISSFPYATDMHREIQRLLWMCVVGVGRYCAGRGTAGKL